MGLCLIRFTTRYVATEDRLCLAGVSGDEEPLSVWLTARALGRLVPRLLAWLGEGGTVKGEPASPRLRLQQDLKQADAQHRAMALRAAARPVAPTAPAAVPWLVRSFSLASGRVLTVEMRGSDGEAASVRFTQVALRQWLAILCRLYRRAGWALDVWPVWLLESTEPAAPQALLH